jgi:hypothetical protein
MTEIFASSSSSVGASAAAGMSSQCPVQTDALSHAAERRRIQGRTRDECGCPLTRGIDVFGVTLDPSGAAVFGRSQHVPVRRLEDLPARLAELDFRLARR